MARGLLWSTAFACFILPGCRSTEPAPSSDLASLSASGVEPVNAGWNVLNGPYKTPSLVDGFIFEWQYFMVHDAQKQFTGSIGFVLVDPKGRLGATAPNDPIARFKNMLFPISIMPSGASVAVAGTWADGSQFANYERFASDYTVSPTGKSFRAKDERKGLRADLVEVETITPGGGTFKLEGRTPDAEWKLDVTPDWAENNGDAAELPFGPISGNDVGFLPGERWTVHMQWPRTRVTGTMKNRKTGASYNVSGHGYRENSWGRWNFALDGWAFSVASDAARRVQWAWQTYHKSKDMDWLDVAFVDRGQQRRLRFFAKEDTLRWRLKDWFFHTGARQCVPNAVEVVAQNADYRVRAAYDLTGKQLPMLSSATPLTRVFVIMIHMPVIKGTIENVRTGELVTAFEAQGGGEFSTTRSVWRELPEERCENWGRRFNTEYGATAFAP